MDDNLNNTNLPKKELTDEEVQSLLAINSLQAKDIEKGSKSFLIVVIPITILVIGLSLFLQSKNAHDTKPTPSNTSSSSAPFNSNSTINQQVQYCSNVLHAQTSC